MSNYLYEIALSLVPNIGPIKSKVLIAYLGSAEAVFKADRKLLSKIPNIGSFALKELNKTTYLKRAEQELKFIEQNQIKVLYYQNKDYPKLLKEAVDAPILLYTKGQINFDKKNIAIVGTRKATPYGKKLTQQLIEDLSVFDLNIISGLAYGIDIEAHKSSLKNGLSTIGVFAKGLDSIYPVAHKAVANQMLENGGWVSEFISKTPGDASYFVKRNRIVAGICEATIVVESAFKGGSLITAGLANDYNREVFAFPGNIDKESSKGCNALIQKSRAHLITCAQDMVDVLGWEQPLESSVIQTNLFVEISDDEKRILDVLKDKGHLHIDAIVNLVNMSISTLSVHLFNLEMKNLIRALSGKRYEIVN
jgi:DNA processing protein